MIGQEDNRHVFPVGCEAILQIATIETQKLNIENETTRHKSSATTQKLRHGLECLWLPPRVADQQFK